MLGSHFPYCLFILESIDHDNTLIDEVYTSVWTKQYQKNSSGFDQVSFYTNSDVFVSLPRGLDKFGFNVDNVASCAERRQPVVDESQPYWHTDLSDLWDLWLGIFSAFSILCLIASYQLCRQCAACLSLNFISWSWFSLVSLCYSNTTFLENESPWVFPERCLSGERGVLLFPQTDSGSHDPWIPWISQVQRKPRKTLRELILSWPGSVGWRWRKKQRVNKLKY